MPLSLSQTTKSCRSKESDAGNRRDRSFEEKVELESDISLRENHSAISRNRSSASDGLWAIRHT